MSPAENRDEQGRFKSEHGISKEDVYEAMEQLEPYTTGEIAEKVSVPRRTIYKYLEQLHDEGKIRKKKPEPRRAIWIRGA